ncbi:MAG: hypothetical protein WCG25_03530 [bacterium]
MIKFIYSCKNKKYMETKNLIIGALVVFFFIFLWVYCPLKIKEKEEAQKRKETDIQLLKKSEPQEKPYYSKVKYKGYAKDPLLIYIDRGKKTFFYKDTMYIDASDGLYGKFLLDAMDSGSR